jgi:branched-chain amino acid aminotransferase
MHRFLLYNGQIHEASEKLLSPGQTGLLNGWGVFSTIRVFDGFLFAFERHWARMKRDAALLSVPFPADPADMEAQLTRLVEANHALNATLRVAVVRNRGGAFEGPGITRDYDLIAFTTYVKDWGSGVKLGLVSQARHAGSPFAGTKMLSWSFNLVWLEEAQRRGFDEVVLLNERGEVSECTSANIFISTGNQIWTPPLTSGCLPGVTRELLLLEVHAPGITIGEKTLLPKDLEAADEVFITSTTRELLPVISIEGLAVRQAGKAREAMQSAFSRYVDAYVAGRRQLQPAIP